MAAVREATAADADAIADVHAETWRATYVGVFPETAFDPTGRWRVWRLYFDEPWPGSAVFVADDGDAVAGFASRKVEEFQGAVLTEVRYRKPL